MRQTLLLLALTCAPAFCQDDSLNRQLEHNLQQRLQRMNLLGPHPVFKLQIGNNLQTEKVCSIPLLNAKPSAKPVHMPTLHMPQGASGASGALTEPQVFDRIAIKPPAPACPAR